MGETTWRSRDVVGWLDHDQSGVLKLTSVVKFAWAAYRQFTVELAGLSRIDYFTKHGCAPVIAFLEVTSAGPATRLDDEIHMDVRARVGFVPGEAPRYGGITLLTLTDENGVELGQLRNHWFWFNTETRSVQREPVFATVDQDEALEEPPERPRLGGDANVQPFRWALRDTDLNHHANTAAYLERAENAIADLGLDAVPLRQAKMWFRRPSFLGETMHTGVQGIDHGALVDIASTDGDVRCTLQFNP